MKASKPLVVLFAACAVAASVFAGTASAYDAHPCGRPVMHSGPLPNGTFPVQYCPVWRGNVPVYAWPTSHSRIVGYLRQGGDVNWFVYQMCTAYWYNPLLHVTNFPLRLGPYISGWWAYTVSDRGRDGKYHWGYVNEVYFSGGSNWQADRGLRKAGPGSTRWSLSHQVKAAYCRW